MWERPECDCNRMKKPSNSEPALWVGGTGSDASGSHFDTAGGTIGIVVHEVFYSV